MDVIPYEDFAKLDIRVARIKSVEAIPEKTRIIKGIIDFGGTERTVIIGGAQFFDIDTMIGKTVIALVNLEPKRIAGIESNAMLLAADVDGVPFWLTVSDDVPDGSKIK